MCFFTFSKCQNEAFKELKVPMTIWFKIELVITLNILVGSKKGLHFHNLRSERLGNKGKK